MCCIKLNTIQEIKLWGLNSIHWSRQMRSDLLIIRVPHKGLFDAQMKTIETIEHVQIEFFILIIRVPHFSSTDI